MNRFLKLPEAFPLSQISSRKVSVVASGSVSVIIDDMEVRHCSLHSTAEDALDSCLPMRAIFFQ